jgi:hypothetical protein
MFLAAPILKGIATDEPGQKLKKEKESTVMLLKPKERLVCEQLTAGQPPYSQRAVSLLALDAGATQTAAAHQSGQTVGQVRYWLGKFRKNRMGIFPEELLPQSEPERLLSQELPDQPTAPEGMDLDQPGKQDTAGEQPKGATAEAERVKKGKAKSKKKSKKNKAAKKTNKKKKSKSGKKRRGKTDKKGK